MSGSNMKFMIYLVTCPQSRLDNIFFFTKKNMEVKLNIMDKILMYDTNVIPMMYFDQFNVIAAHLQQKICYQ